MATEKTPRRLGRGLEALLGSATGLASSDEGALKSIPISQIGRNPFQPRQEFNIEELNELKESLSASGLLQPITVRRRAGRDGFELIAGERRLRAASALGWKEIPAIIKEIDDRTLLTLALVENLQRADLNPIEEGEGYHQLADQFGLTQQQIAETVGKDRSTIANMLRLGNRFIPSSPYRRVPSIQTRLYSACSPTTPHPRPTRPARRGRRQVARCARRA